MYRKSSTFMFLLTLLFAVPATVAVHGTDVTGTLFGLLPVDENEKGIPQKFAQAMEWSLKAAQKGDATAQFNLGYMYSYGLGVPQDYEKAVQWYRGAAEQGHAGAQNNLGALYEQGLGVTQDFVSAHMWYNLAAAQLTGSEREAAARNRDELAESMTLQQVAEAQQRAGQWKPRK